MYYNLHIKINVMGDSILVLHESLNTGGPSNVVSSEVCGKWGKARMVWWRARYPRLNFVIVLRTTKVNLRCKIGSAIPKSSRPYLGFGAEKNVRGIDETVYSVITNMTNTNTGEFLRTIRRILKTNNIKRGNPGKVVRLNLGTVQSKVSDFTRAPALQLYHRSFMYVVINNNLFCSKMSHPEFYRIYGGKIREKANALSNSKDTVSGTFLSKYLGARPRVIHNGEKLNSLCLGKNLLDRCYYSSARDESKSIKRQLLEEVMFKWPNSKTLGEIRKDVFKQQLSLVSLAEKHGPSSHAVFKRQKILFNSLFFRIVAVDKLSKSKGSRTPGVDGISIGHKKDPELLIRLLAVIRQVAKNPFDYKASPIRRVWIPKDGNDFRPLGIPTLQDRALQHLINLILEPLVEMTSEPHSFGFRPNRFAKQAISILRANLRTRDPKAIRTNTSKSNTGNALFELLPERKVILDADIQGFFDNINHSWILDKLFLHPELLALVKAWLVSGILEKNIFFETVMGTPQGGIISPCLANFTLNGLESTIMNSINPVTKSKDKRIFVRLKDGSRTRIASGLFYVRYADDFVVMARSNYLIRKFILPSIRAFLKDRGLKLNESKTKIFRLADKGAQLDFLGYTFKYQDKWSVKSKVFYTKHAGSRGIALYPNRKKVLDVIKRIKFIFKVSSNFSAYNLIVKLNPIIRGWSNYFNMANSSHYRDTVRNAVFRLTWLWARKKHRRWGRKLIASNYFLSDPLSSGVYYRKIKYSKFKNRKWVFHGKVFEKLRYNPSNYKTIYLVDVSNISQLLSSKFYILPKKYLYIHGYHQDYMKLVEHNTNVNLKAGGPYSSFKERLLKRQNNICPHCNEILLGFDYDVLGNSSLHIHHIKPIYKGGSSKAISNMVLLHSWCHYDIDHGKLSG